MKTKICVTILTVLSLVSFGQVTTVATVAVGQHEKYEKPQHKVRVRNGIDTSNIIFKEIFQFWQNYQNDLMLADAFNNTNRIHSKYWAASEIQKYGNPDLIRDFVWYHYLSEYFVGIEKRNDTLYELKSIYYSDYNSTTNPDISIAFSLFVAKIKNGYKLYNKLTSNEKLLNRKELSIARKDINSFIHDYLKKY